MKFKIFLTLGFAFCITLGMLFSLMNLYINIYDPEWNGVFSNEKIKNNEKRIFLIGASNVYSIDVDRISEKISSNDVEYGIYNLWRIQKSDLNNYSQFLVNSGYKSDWKNRKVEKF